MNYPGMLLDVVQEFAASAHLARKRYPYCVQQAQGMSVQRRKGRPAAHVFQGVATFRDGYEVQALQATGTEPCSLCGGVLEHRVGLRHPVHIGICSR